MLDYNKFTEFAIRFANQMKTVRQFRKKWILLTTYYKAKQLILADRILDHAYLGVKDGKICEITQTMPSSEKADVKDYSQAIISAGLVDTHIHGYHQADVMDNSEEALKTISQGILEMGVTSWLATTLTSSTEALNDVCETIGNSYQRMPGAKIQGIFLEGPYFTEKFKGAQNDKYMSDPSIDQLKHWHDVSGHFIKKIAIAPERQGVEEFIQAAKDLGIYVALGHSDATLAQAQTAVNAGANIFVHVYNGMRGLHHREPGMVGAAMTIPNVFAELIADGHHVHPMAARVVAKMRGSQETVLITDCMRAGGIGDGDSYLGELTVMVKDGQARLVEGGNLAGSVLNLMDGVTNMVQWDNATLADALRMASYAPAKSVGLEEVCGQLKVGMPADFIVLSKQGQLQATYVDGKCLFQR